MSSGKSRTRPEDVRAAMERLAQWAERRLVALRREDFRSEVAYKRELTRRRNAVLRATRIREAIGV